jgi:hypothetical protein
LKRTGQLCLMASTFLVLGACSSSRAPEGEPSGGRSTTTVFGDELSLTGYSIGNKDGRTEVELQWKALHKPSSDYLVFVHAAEWRRRTSFSGRS